MTVLGNFQSFPHIPDQVAPDTEGGLIGLALIAPFLQSSDKPLAVPTLGTAAYLSPAPTAPRPAQLVRAYQNDR
jgi:hypothetical protein